MRTLAFLLTALAAAPALAQPPIAFEVASIKPSGPKSVVGWEGGPGSKDPTRYSYGSASMLALIFTAYNIQPFQISSPMPLEGQRFDLVANVPADATKEQFRVMLQNLLAERFGLKVHIVSKEFPAYELVVAKSGFKLKEGVAQAARETGWPDLPPNRPGLIAQYSTSGGFEVVRLRAQEQSIAQLAGRLSRPDDPPVVDKTGLTGKYSFALEYTKDLPGTPDAPPPAPSLGVALQQQLGLQLIFKKLPFDVVVVESFNKLPAEN